MFFLRHTCLLPFLCFVLLSSCGGSDSYDSYEGHLFHPHVNLEETLSLEKEINKMSFSCEDPSQCPENVLMLYSKMRTEKGVGIGKCTGFVIGKDKENQDEDIIVTNSHCIPVAVKKGDACSDQMVTKFLSQGAKETVFPCTRFISASELATKDLVEAFWGKDIAFFAIKSSGRKPFKVEKNGFSENERISIAKINYPLKLQSASLQVEKCKISMRSFLNFRASNKWSKTGLADGCRVIPGNSGSPMLNESGKVIGVAQSYMKDYWREVLEGFLKPFVEELPDELPAHTNFTNLSCVNDPVYGIKNKEKCESFQRTTIIECLAEEFLKYQEVESAFVEEWKDSLPDIFIYNYIRLGASSLSYAEIQCVKNREQHAKYDQVVKEGVLEFSFEDHVYTKVNLGPFYEISSPLKTVFERSNEYFYRLELQGQKWSGLRKDFVRGIDKDEQLEIPICTDEEIREGNQEWAWVHNELYPYEESVSEATKIVKANADTIQCER